jgi:hypothetical protein
VRNLRHASYEPSQLLGPQLKQCTIFNSRLTVIKPPERCVQCAVEAGSEPWRHQYQHDDSPRQNNMPSSHMSCWLLLLKVLVAVMPILDFTAARPTVCRDLVIGDKVLGESGGAATSTASEHVCHKRISSTYTSARHIPVVVVCCYL